MGDCDREMKSCNSSRGQMGGSAQCMALKTVIPASLGSAEEFLGERDSAGCLKYVV